MTWQPPLESLNHSPTELCPHPEYWHAWNSVSTEVEVSILVASFVRALQPENILEIGAHYGQTTERIAQVIRESGHGKFVSLEVDKDLLGSASHRCFDYIGKEVDIVWANSLNYIPDQAIDFLFIDGSDARSKDLEHFLPFLAERCCVIVHDTDYYLPETARILELWTGEHITLHSPRGLMVLTR